MHFSTCRPGKTMETFTTIFGIRNNVGKTYKHIKFWLRSVDRARRHTVVKCYGFVTFFSPFFHFSSASSSRLQVPIAESIRTFNSSKDVFCFVHVPFLSLEPSN